MSGKFLAISLVVIGVWGLFVFTAPDLVVQFVCLCIAGWQVGGWAFYIADYFTKEFDENV